MNKQIQTWLPSELYVNIYKTKPLEAADKLFEAWQKERTTHIDIHSCSFTCKEFLDAFLDKCRENDLLKEGLKVMWGVHSIPGPEHIPMTFHYIDQWIMDYSVKYGMESETVHLKGNGLEQFELVQELKKMYDDVFFITRIACVFPNPRDENGRYIPMIEDKDGKVIPWPKNEDGSFVKLD